MKSYASNARIRREEKQSRHINVLAHYDNETLIDKSGKLIKIMKLSGLNSFVTDTGLLDNYKNRRNNLLKSFSSEFAFYFWDVRNKIKVFPGGEFGNGFAKDVNAKYQERINKNDMYCNEIYLAIMTKPAEGIVNKFFSIFRSLGQTFDKTALKSYQERNFRALSDAANRIVSSLSDYDCQVLSVYQNNGETFSAPLKFLSRIINCDQFNVPLRIVSADKVLPRKRLFFNSKSGTIETRSADGSKKFSALLSIKAYTPITYQGMLDQLNTLKCEYLLTQSYRPYDKHNAKTRLRDQQHEMLQSKEESISQTEQIDESFDDAASGELGFGKHHFSLACYADSQEELNQHIGTIISRLSDVDVACVREDIACECAFWAQLPGNFGYIARPADISTKNMASFASLHNSPQGKLFGNHWGDAVTVFETINGSPFYFNFHYKDVGNFLVFGSMGSGKTLLVGFLILQSMKFGGKRIIFDKDRGLEILVRSLRGTYEIIKPGKSTGLNPCQLSDTPENRQFLVLLFKKMLGASSESDSKIIEDAISGMYRLDPASRQLCHIASFFGAKKPNSLRNRFDQWHSDGLHAWAFDNAVDKLNLNADVLGFDLGHILNHEECKTPVLMYLTYRIEQAIEGERAILFCDEGWQLLNDAYFKNLISDWSRTPRKKNNIFGLATQAANDTSGSEIHKSINESAFCKIFFPNPSADKKVYVDNLGLTEHEYELIKTLSDDQHYFLLNHGRGPNKQSVVVRLNLTGCEDLIAIISARESTLLLFDAIRTEVGDDPNIWVPVFLERYKNEARS